MNCYDCPYFKIVYKNTLVGQAFCTKYTKFIPKEHFAYNFFCWDKNVDEIINGRNDKGTS